MKDFKSLLIIVAILALIFVISLRSCQLRQTEQALRESRQVIDDLRRVNEQTNLELIKQKDLLNRSNDAINRADKEIKKALKRYEERNEDISNSDSEWLMCPIPDGVREAFTKDHIYEASTQPP